MQGRIRPDLSAIERLCPHSEGSVIVLSVIPQHSLHLFRHLSPCTILSSSEALTSGPAQDDQVFGHWTQSRMELACKMPKKAFPGGGAKNIAGWGLSQGFCENSCIEAAEIMADPRSLRIAPIS